MQGRHYMGLPLSAPQATSTKPLGSLEDAPGSQLKASCEILKETVKTGHGVYSFSMAITEQQGCSPADIRKAGHGAAGRHSDTGRHTVLLLHGFMGCAADWEHVAASLAVTCRCVSVDLPGHGATETSSEGVSDGSSWLAGIHIPTRHLRCGPFSRGVPDEVFRFPAHG